VNNAHLLFSCSDFGVAWQECVVEKICAKIYESSGSLAEEFKKFDKDGDGMQ
jgi:hypothetical protein